MFKDINRYFFIYFVVLFNGIFWFYCSKYNREFGLLGYLLNIVVKIFWFHKFDHNTTHEKLVSETALSCCENKISLICNCITLINFKKKSGFMTNVWHYFSILIFCYFFYVTFIITDRKIKDVLFKWYFTKCVSLRICESLKLQLKWLKTISHISILSNKYKRF